MIRTGPRIDSSVNQASLNTPGRGNEGGAVGDALPRPATYAGAAKRAAIPPPAEYSAAVTITTPRGTAPSAGGKMVCRPCYQLHRLCDSKSQCQSCAEVGDQGIRVLTWCVATERPASMTPAVDTTLARYSGMRTRLTASTQSINIEKLINFSKW